MEKITAFKTTSGAIIESEAAAIECEFGDRLRVLLGRQESWTTSGGSGTGTFCISAIRENSILENADAVIKMLTEYKAAQNP